MTYKKSEEYNMKKRAGILLMAMLMFIAVLVVVVFVAAGSYGSMKDNPVVPPPVPKPVPRQPQPKDPEDNNKSPSIAKPMLVNTEVFASLVASSDSNTFIFTLESPGSVILEFSHQNLTHNHKGWRIRLCDDRSNEMVSFDSFWNELKTSSPTIGLPAGSYLVIVDTDPASYNYSWNSAQYALTVKYAASECWETESNELFETADPVKTNLAIAGTLKSPSDEDFFTFTLDGPGYVTLDFNHANLTYGQQGWRVRLSDENSNELFDLTSKWNDPTVSGPQVGLPKGRYYVIVDTDPSGLYYTWNAAPYSLTVNHTASTDWETEFNNVFGDADRMKLNQAIFGTLRTSTDTDCFEFKLDSPEKIELAFSHKNLNTFDKGWRLRLYDESSNELSRFSSSWNEPNAESPIVELLPGLYYIMIDVYAYEYYAWNAERYSLTVRSVAEGSASRLAKGQQELSENLPISIISNGSLMRDCLLAFLHKNNPDLNLEYASEVIDLYMTEAGIEGINYEIAFAQMCFHTNYLKFTKTAAKKETNNFFGLLQDDKKTAYVFDSMAIGVRAHIQHLKGYATKDALIQECVDPRYGIIKHGSAPTLDGLSGKWAGLEYADKIREILRKMKT
jgi:hypothetical protein